MQYSKSVISNRVIIQSMINKMEQLANDIIKELLDKAKEGEIIWDGNRSTVGMQVPAFTCSRGRKYALHQVITQNHTSLVLIYSYEPGESKVIHFDKLATKQQKIDVACFVCEEIMEKAPLAAPSLAEFEMKPMTEISGPKYSDLPATTVASQEVEEFVLPVQPVYVIPTVKPHPIPALSKDARLGPDWKQKLDRWKIIFDADGHNPSISEDQLPLLMELTEEKQASLAGYLPIGAIWYVKYGFLSPEYFIRWIDEDKLIQNRPLIVLPF